MSVKFVSAILGPEMAAPILWTPGKDALFLQEKPMSIKFRVLGGVVFWVLGGGSADFIFMGAGIFLIAGKVFWQISTLLENSSPIVRQHETQALPRFGHFPARKMAAGKSASRSETLLDFLL